MQRYLLEIRVQGSVQSTKLVPYNLTLVCNGSKLYVTGTQKKMETFRLTFASNGKSEFVPRDQVFALLVLNCSLLPQKIISFKLQ